MVVRRPLLVDIGGFRKDEGAQDYDVGLRLMERTDKIHHIPKILYHWRKIPESVASSVQLRPGRWTRASVHSRLRQSPEA
jgi:cellulose synthase/poly-beta-1,6-N-acetylglucosamine synthase-like glycosyltransferase